METKGVDPIPFVDLSGLLERGSERWEGLCQEVRKACESFGFFIVKYDGIPGSVKEEMFEAMKDVFDLPKETKKKNYDPRPYFGYLGGSDLGPLYESLGVEAATEMEAAEAFTRHMWPDGNPEFCQRLNSMSREMLELNLMIRRMLFESFGAEEGFDSHVESTGSVFRIMNYKAPAVPPEGGPVSAVGLVDHTDKNLLTVLCEGEVEGLQVQSKDGLQWFDVAHPKDTFIVLIGETFKAWSNGRFNAPRHRVVMGEKERFSCAIFSTPKEGSTVEVQKELVDKDHPLVFKPFKYLDYIAFFNANRGGLDSVEAFAGIKI